MKIKRKTIINQLNILCLIVIYSAIHSLGSNNLIAGKKIDHPEKIIKSITFKQVLVIGGEDNAADPNYVLYKPRSLTYDGNSNIFILDRGNFRVQIFNNRGEFKNSFGRKGKGPGEFSGGGGTQFIKYLNDGKLYIIDNDLLRISIFDTSGTFIYSIPVTAKYQNLIKLKNGNLVAANLRFEKEHQPLHVFNPSGKIVRQFGTVDEPSVGFFDKTKKFAELITYLSFSHSINLVVDENENIYYCQMHPYVIKKYNSEGKLIKSFFKKWDLDFGIYPNIKIKNGVKLRGFPKVMAGISELSIFNNKYLLAFMYKDDLNWVDVFDLDGKYFDSFKLSFAKNEVPSGAADTGYSLNNYYYLVGAPEELHRLIIYSHDIKKIFDK